MTIALCPQDAGNNSTPDKLLCKREGCDGRTVTCWRPESIYKLQGVGEAYVPARQVVVAVPQGATSDPEGRWSLQPVTLSDHRLTSLEVMMPGHPPDGVLLSVILHPREEEALLQVDFPAVIDYLRNFYEIGIHLLEIVEDEMSATTRFFVGSWQDPRVPHLPLYRPGVSGGPWHRDITGNHKFLGTMRSYRRDQRLPHHLEFFLFVDSEKRARLEELCSEILANDTQDLEEVGVESTSTTH